MWGGNEMETLPADCKCGGTQDLRNDMAVDVARILFTYPSIIRRLL